MTGSVGRRLFELVEPVAVVTYMANEPTEAVMALGFDNVWDAYFAGRAAPLGSKVRPEVVHALFYNFAAGEVARHIPRVWDTITPGAANAAREHGSVAALRRILGERADTPGIVRAGDLAIKAGTSARTEGRALFAAVRTLPVPTEPVARLWHGANLLREHRGDGHVAALVTAGIGGTEAHVLHALSEGTPAGEFGRVSHLPHTQLAEVILDESGYTEMWQKDRSADAQGRLDNLKELVRSMDGFENLQGFLEHISLVMDREDGALDDAVSIMTLHSAKGLEFDNVFLPGWEEGLFPSQRTLDDVGSA